MRKCADMKYHFAAEVRIYPSSQQKHIIAVNDGASRFVYNRMTARQGTAQLKESRIPVPCV